MSTHINKAREEYFANQTSWKWFEKHLDNVFMVPIATRLMLEILKELQYANRNK